MIIRASSNHKCLIFTSFLWVSSVEFDSSYSITMRIILGELEYTNPFFSLSYPYIDISCFQPDYQCLTFSYSIWEKLYSCGTGVFSFWKFAMRSTDIRSVDTMPYFDWFLFFSWSCHEQRVIIWPREAPNNSRMSIFHFFYQTKLKIISIWRRCLLENGPWSITRTRK